MMVKMMKMTINCKLGSFSEVLVGSKSWFQQGCICAAFKFHLGGHDDAACGGEGGTDDAEHADDDGDDDVYAGADADADTDAVDLFPNILDTVDLRPPHPPESLLAAVQSSFLSWH